MEFAKLVKISLKKISFLRQKQVSLKSSRAWGLYSQHKKAPLSRHNDHKKLLKSLANISTALNISAAVNISTVVNNSNCCEY